MFSQLEQGLISIEELDNLMGNKDSPLKEMASPQLAEDIRALKQLMNTEESPLFKLRSTNIVTVVFGFGDASGTGLGSTFTCDSGFTYRIGVWGSLEKDESSNWKEFTNVVEAMEEEASAGRLNNSELFMFTDNSTVEACAFKGSSSSLKLLDLIVRLKSMPMNSGFRINIFHMAGTRMIAQGTDGVSRGCLAQGIMAGEAMCAFIPIHLSAMDRSALLLPWIRSWCGSEAMLLSELDWFERGHDIEGWTVGHGSPFQRPIISENRTFIWSPPPFAADCTLAELKEDENQTFAFDVRCG